MQKTKPFFQALESILRNRVPADEYAQILEESLWEFESGPQMRGTGQASLARLASICVSFYRAMTKMGMRPETALGSLAQAGRELHWTKSLPPAREACPLALYCRSKNAASVCKAVFCVSCPERGKGCEAAADLPEDWSASRPATAA